MPTPSENTSGPAEPLSQETFQGRRWGTPEDAKRVSLINPLQAGISWNPPEKTEKVLTHLPREHGEPLPTEKISSVCDCISCPSPRASISQTGVSVTKSWQARRGHISRRCQWRPSEYRTNLQPQGLLKGRGTLLCRSRFPQRPHRNKIIPTSTRKFHWHNCRRCKPVKFDGHRLFQPNFALCYIHALKNKSMLLFCSHCLWEGLWGFLSTCRKATQNGNAVSGAHPHNGKVTKLYPRLCQLMPVDLTKTRTISWFSSEEGPLKPNKTGLLSHVHPTPSQHSSNLFICDKIFHLRFCHGTVQFI